MTASLDHAEEILEAARADVDAVLHRWAAGTTPAIAYSLTGPGKRLRGALAIESYRAAGGSSHEIAELASVIEVIHAYSLVHDDLPCMDNDDLRRGRPTTHRAFDTRAATVAGFAMVPLAARVLAEAVDRLGLSEDTARRIGSVLFRAAGAGGMIGGQFRDLAAEGQELSLNALEELHGAKTGALITAACLAGALAAGASDRVLEGLRGFGREVGLAFQIADDVLDARGTTEEIGKTAGKDAVQAKATFVAALGLEEALAEAERRSGIAMDALHAAGISSESLLTLAHFIVHRRS